MMLDDSKDEAITSPKPTLKTGKWKVRDTISAKDNLAFKEIIGHTQTGRQEWSKVSGKNHQDMVIHDVRSEVDHKRFLKGVQQSQQGQWEDTLKMSITWNDIWQMAPLRLSFLICSTYNQLSSKNNLFKWKKESNPTCPLCSNKPQTLEHVLSSCKTLGNGTYT